jgi:hypothetical protein
MSLDPLHLISAHPWQRAAFTTYALSLSFFEAIVLDALVRAEAHEALILADVDGVRAALGEQGARRVGRDYEVEPVAVEAGGVFHPKITVLTAPDECHLLVGSGNLTFGGWGGNFEVIEHLHPSFAADAIEDAAGFFDLLSATGHIRHAAGEHCASIASDLRAAIRGTSRNGGIRIFHSLDGAISEKLVEAADDLGGATRLVVAAPFWDEGSALDRLCAGLKLDEAFLQVHPGGTVEGNIGSNWPARARSRVRPVTLDHMNEPDPRRLHAKLLEILCKRGRILLSGSANMTAAALGARRNVEACVARIQREPVSGWRFRATEAPILWSPSESELHDEESLLGVLRAVLEGDQIAGQVLSPSMTGAASFSQLTTEGPEPLGEADIAADGSFSIITPGLEMQSWRGGRLVLRVENAKGQRAEGFISVAAFAEITRRAGAMGTRLLALLAGTETPADVAAIMSWFHDDPTRLPSARASMGGGGDGRGPGETGQTIAVSTLNSAHALHHTERTGSGGSGAASWSRFMQCVFAAFREKRGPLGHAGVGHKGDDDDDVETQDPREAARTQRFVQSSLANFEKLLDLLLSDENAPSYAMSALDLTQYVCQRLQPDPGTARRWVNRVVDTIIRVGPPPEGREETGAAVLALLGASEEGAERTARSRLIRLGWDLSGEAPSPDAADGLQSVLTQAATFPELWARVQKVRTYSEQVRAYVSALQSGQPSTEYAELAEAAREEWPALERALGSPQYAQDRVIVLPHWSNACPRHYMTLPAIEEAKLRTIGIATCKNCCNRVLLFPGNS